MKYIESKEQRKSAHSIKMKERRKRQLERTAGFTPVNRTGIKSAMTAMRDSIHKPQPYKLHSDCRGYDVLHYTKGWRRICARRLDAQKKMQSLLAAA